MSDDAPLSPLRDAVEVAGKPHAPDPHSLQPETLAIGFGYDPTTASGAAKPPVYLTSTYVYPSAEHAKAVHAA